MTNLSLDQTLAPAPPDKTGLPTAYEGMAKAMAGMEKENEALRQSNATLTAELKEMAHASQLLSQDYDKNSEQIAALTARLEAVTGERDDAYKALTVIGEQKDAMKAMRDELLRDEYKLVQERDKWHKSSDEFFEIVQATKPERELQAELTTLRAQVAELRRIGAMFANFAYNVSQDNAVSERYRSQLKAMQTEWDAALAPGGGVGE